MMLLFLTLENPEDRDMFEYIYERYAKTMLNAAYQILNNQKDAEDAVHDCFVTLMEMPDKLRKMPDNERKAFLLICARNKAQDILRKNRRIVLLEGDSAALTENTPTLSESDDSLILQIKNEIAQLPHLHQEMLVLHYYLGLNYREIGTLTGKKAGSVQRTVSRLRKELHEKVERGRKE